MSDDKLRVIADCVIEGRFEDSKSLVQSALDSGIDAQAIITEGLRAGMGVVGERFKNDEIFVPEVLISARAMKAGMEILRDQLTSGATDSAGTVVIGTVQGDLHDIGKSLVAMMMEGAGFEMIDLGTDVSPEAFVEAAKEHNADIVGMSALLTTTMPRMADIVSAVKSGGFDHEVKTLIGGAPVTQDFAEEIGANAYAPDAASAVETAKELVGSGS